MLLFQSGYQRYSKLGFPDKLRHHVDHVLPCLVDLLPENHLALQELLVFVPLCGCSNSSIASCTARSLVSVVAIRSLRPEVAQDRHKTHHRSLSRETRHPRDSV